MKKLIQLAPFEHRPGAVTAQYIRRVRVVDVFTTTVFVHARLSTASLTTPARLGEQSTEGARVFGCFPTVSRAAHPSASRLLSSRRPFLTRRRNFFPSESGG
jgi:hypothetical protein